MEVQNFLIGNDIEFVKSIMMTMASSLQARRNVGDLYVDDIFEYDGINIDDNCKNRNIEVLNTKFKCMGVGIEWRDKDGNIVHV